MTTGQFMTPTTEALSYCSDSARFRSGDGLTRCPYTNFRLCTGDAATVALQGLGDVAAHQYNMMIVQRRT